LDRLFYIAIAKETNQLRCNPPIWLLGTSGDHRRCLYNFVSTLLAP